MQIAHCKHCEYSCSLRGIYGHLRFKHGITPSTNDFDVSIENDAESPQSNIYPVYPTRSNVPVREIRTVTTDLLESKRNEVEMKKLDLEMQRLEKGNTNADPFDKLLTIMQENNKQVLEMQKQNFENKLEIEKLKLSGDSGEDLPESLLRSILPLLPSILASKNNETNKQNPDIASKGETPKPVDVDIKQVPKEYIDLIKSGKLTMNDAWGQYQIAVRMGKAPKVTKKQFAEEFQKIKNS